MVIVDIQEDITALLTNQMTVMANQVKVIADLEVIRHIIGDGDHPLVWLLAIEAN